MQHVQLRNGLERAHFGNAIVSAVKLGEIGENVEAVEMLQIVAP